MRIISLAPFITEVICALGLEAELVGISHRCDYPDVITTLPRLTCAHGTSLTTSGRDEFLEGTLCPDIPLLSEIRNLKPDVIVTTAPRPGWKIDSSQVKEHLAKYITEPFRLLNYTPLTLENIWAMLEDMGKDLGAAARGRELGQRYKAQLMDWGDNFYDRMKNKRVTFLSGIDPFILGGLWIPDLIHLCSCISQVKVPGEAHLRVEWQTIVEFRPDVIIVAPERKSLQNSLQTFKLLEKLPDWEKIPAVRRGEVTFTDGLAHFYRPGPRLIDSMGILISSIAGIDSGYITPRDSFYRLRWLELQRHRL